MLENTSAFDSIRKLFVGKSTLTSPCQRLQVLRAKIQVKWYIVRLPSPCATSLFIASKFYRAVIPTDQPAVFLLRLASTDLLTYSKHLFKNEWSSDSRLSCLHKKFYKIKIKILCRQDRLNSFLFALFAPVIVVT